MKEKVVVDINYIVDKIIERSESKDNCRLNSFSYSNKKGFTYDVVSREQENIGMH